MRKIHVLTRKEEIDSFRLTNCTAVIIDVLLATTTIAATLYYGAREVIPVTSPEEAIELSVTLGNESYILAGEKDGYPIPGFTKPDPLELIKTDLTGKSLIFSTTNGTVAIGKSVSAKHVYTSSFLNGAEVARQISEDDDKGSVVIICAGSIGNFSIEDFLGAGYLITELVKDRLHDWSLSDSAHAAVQLFEHLSEQIEQCIASSATGILLKELGYADTITYAAQRGGLPVIPKLVRNTIPLCLCSWRHV